ncbi:MAG: hypothetical protein IPK78_18450 [Rhodospirillales bacterium]|nr:hypothetical protein [Rhodospirillales bacterium]
MEKGEPTLVSRAPDLLLTAVFALTVAACESGGGGAGVGTVGGAALGAGAGRAVFGNSTSAMLIGGAVGGMAGNMTIDRQNQERQFQQQQTSQDTWRCSGNWISSGSEPFSRRMSSVSSRSNACSTIGGANRADDGK